MSYTFKIAPLYKTKLFSTKYFRTWNLNSSFTHDRGGKSKLSGSLPPPHSLDTVTSFIHRGSLI